MSCSYSPPYITHSPPCRPLTSLLTLHSRPHVVQLQSSSRYTVVPMSCSYALHSRPHVVQLQSFSRYTDVPMSSSYSRSHVTQSSLCRAVTVLFSLHSRPHALQLQSSSRNAVVPMSSSYNRHHVNTDVPMSSSYSRSHVTQTSPCRAWSRSACVSTAHYGSQLAPTTANGINLKPLQLLRPSWPKGFLSDEGPRCAGDTALHPHARLALL
ncbi:hypothetical protein BaRGS_00034766 [Batillaria attramentaria]|uniref:Uncharacterized protein n=1 Tax=Batillaria attramentaria TaxID=370345 RepID=A0ABD0JGI1_9CAEN